MTRDREALQEHERLLEPWQRLYEREVGRLVDASDEELARFAEAAAAMTQTNCGWSTYAVAQIVLHHAAYEQRRRASLTPSAVPLNSNGKGASE